MQVEEKQGDANHQLNEWRVFGVQTIIAPCEIHIPGGESSGLIKGCRLLAKAQSYLRYDEAVKEKKDCPIGDTI